MSRAGVKIPIIFITGHADIPMTVKAMKSGAFEFLTKPFREQDLLDVIHRALRRDRGVREKQKQLAELQKRYSSLSGRECEVISLVISPGCSTKQDYGKRTQGPVETYSKNPAWAHDYRKIQG